MTHYNSSKRKVSCSFDPATSHELDLTLETGSEIDVNFPRPILHQWETLLEDVGFLKGFWRGMMCVMVVLYSRALIAVSCTSLPRSAGSTSPHSFSSSAAVSP